MTIVVDPTLSGPSGVSLEDVAGRVQRELSDRDNINLLESDISADATTFTLKYPPSAVTGGTLLSVDDEVMHVWEVNISNRSVTVLRGYSGTTPAEHFANSVITAGGKSRRQVIDAINDELMSLSGSGLFQMRSISLSSYAQNTFAYVVNELTGSNIYDVQYRVQGQPNEWVHLPGWQFSAHDSSVTLGCIPPTNNVRVLYKAGFERLEYGTDDVQQDGGLHSEAADVLVLGAAARLAMQDDYIRNNFRSQGDTRRADEVPPGAILRSAQALMGMRDRRLAEEKDRLRRQFPTRKSGW